MIFNIQQMLLGLLPHACGVLGSDASVTGRHKGNKGSTVADADCNEVN